MNSDLEGISLSVPSFGRPLDSMGENSGESGSDCLTLWHDPSVCKSVTPAVISCASDGGSLLTAEKCKTRAVTVVYVRNSEISQPLSPESMALQCLKDACDIVGCTLEIIHFGMLDFGETSVLDHFYNAELVFPVNPKPSTRDMITVTQTNPVLIEPKTTSTVP